MLFLEVLSLVSSTRARSLTTYYSSSRDPTLSGDLCISRHVHIHTWTHTDIKCIYMLSDAFIFSGWNLPPSGLYLVTYGDKWTEIESTVCVMI